jgi:hypothetical protein
MHNPTQKGRIIEMSKLLPNNESDRKAEALELVSMIPEELYPKLTSWERQTIEEVKEGKASTKFRLTEIRRIVKRLTDEG